MMAGCTRMAMAAIPVACLVSLAAPSAAAQDMSDAQRLERCANNRARLAQLQKELEDYPFDWSDEQVARLRAAHGALVELRLEDQSRMSERQWGDYYRRLARAEQQARDVIGALGLRFEEGPPPGAPPGAADLYPKAKPLHEQIESWFRRSALEEPERQALKTAMAAHRTNIVALRCDEPVLAPVQTAAAPPGGPAGPLSGAFDTDFGVMILGPGGGTYNFRDGRIDIGNVIEGSAEGRWTQSWSARDCGGGQYYGRVRLTFTPEGFTGVYGFCDDEPKLGWSGRRRP